MSGTPGALHPSIEKLLNVQKLDREKRFIEEAMVLRPQELEDDRKKVAAAEGGVRHAQQLIQEARLVIDRGELEIKQCDAEIEKATIALNTAKTNQEYAVFKEQISRQQEKRDGIEETTLEQLEQLTQLEANKAKLEKALEEEQKTFARKKAEVDELIAGLASQVSALETERASAVVGIDADHLELYDRILAHVHDAALVEVKDSVCHGCYMQVTTQDRSQILIGEKLVQCKNCGRILFL